jgi:hypothetical protein
MGSNSYCDSNYMGKSVCDNQVANMADGCSIYGEYSSCVDPTISGDTY